MDPVSHQGTVLVLAVVVRRYGPGPKVGVGPDLRIPHVREVRDLAPRPYARVLDLAVSPDLSSSFEDRTGPQERVGTDARPVTDLGPASHRVFHEGAVTNTRVLEVCRGPDHAVRTDPRLPAQQASRQDHGVAPDLDRSLYVRRSRVPHRHPVPHVGVQDAAPENLLGPRKLGAVVDEVRLLRIFEPVGNGPRTPSDRLEYVCEVQLTPLILRGETPDSIPYLGESESVDAEVDEPDLSLVLARVPLFNYPDHAGVLDYPPEAARI